MAENLVVPTMAEMLAQGQQPEVEGKESKGDGDLELKQVVGS